MSPRKQLRKSSRPVSAAVDRLWWTFGQQVRDLRLARGWSVAELARRSGLSPSFVYLIEGGQSGSVEGAARLAIALGKHAELTLADPRQRDDRRPDLGSDLVHSLMGVFETGHFRRLGVPIGVDVPYQHFQFAGRADVVAWDLAKRALLHSENRTRFPDFQSMAGSFNGKRAYLAEAVGKRVGVRRWASQTHVIAAIWSAESLHVVRLRADSFPSVVPRSARRLLDVVGGRPADGRRHFDTDRARSARPRPPTSVRGIGGRSARQAALPRLRRCRERDPSWAADRLIVDGIPI